MPKIKRVLFEELWSLYQVFFLFIPGRLGHRLRGMAFRPFLKSCGPKFSVKENVEIYHPERLSIGRGSGIGRNNVIDAIGYITIGDNVRLGPNVMLATMHHARLGNSIQDGKPDFESVKIGNHVWVGHGATILPGVTIGNNVIVGAGSVVTKSVPDGWTVGGVPSVKLKSHE